MKNNNSSIYNCISPIFYLSKLFGFAPFILPSRDKKPKTSILDYLIVLFYLSAYTLILVCFVTNDYLLSQSESIIFNVGGVIVILISIIIAFISVIVGMIMRNKIHEILEIIDDCDKMLMSMGAVFNYKYHLKVIWAFTIVNLVVVFIAYYGSSQVLNRILYMDLMLTAAYFIESIVYMIIMSQFFMLQAAIKIRFAALNKVFW